MKNLSRCDLLNKKKNMCTFQTNIGNTSQLDFLKHSYGIFINLSSLLFHYIASCRFYYCKKINVGSMISTLCLWITGFKTFFSELYRFECLDVTFWWSYKDFSLLSFLFNCLLCIFWYKKTNLQSECLHF